jgi:uncharacterized protein YndB with AHSA1/START domain
MSTTQHKDTASKMHKNPSTTSPLIEISREFDVPVSQLFDAFKSEEALKTWWWPKGLYADHVEMDFREGGTYFVNMKGFDQGGGGVTGRFEEIVENKRIVMTDQFADAFGKPISAKEAKMQGEWPQELQVTFEFEAIDEDTSCFHLSQEGVPQEMQQECLKGWSSSFDKLEEYLRETKIKSEAV